MADFSPTHFSNGAERSGDSFAHVGEKARLCVQARPRQGDLNEDWKRTKILPPPWTPASTGSLSHTGRDVTRRTDGLRGLVLGKRSHCLADGVHWPIARGFTA